MTKRTLVGSAMRTTVLTVFAAIILLVAPSGLDAARSQETLESMRFKEDPRITNLRKKLFDDFDGAERPLSFRFRIYGLPRDEELRVAAVARRYILDLGGTTVSRDEHFKIIVSASEINSSENGYYKTRDLVVTLRDGRSRRSELIAQGEFTKRCRDFSCDPTMSDWRELFLRLGR